MANTYRIDFGADPFEPGRLIEHDGLTVRLKESNGTVLREITTEEQSVNRIPVFTGESTSDGGGAISVGFVFDANIFKAVGGQTYSSGRSAVWGASALR